MYTGFLHLHNMLRWVLLVVAILVIIKSYAGWFGKKSWAKSDNILGIIFTSVFDLQFLIGTVLYVFLSPIVKSAFHDFGAAMKISSLRFIAVEHLFLMVIALVLVHIGRSKSKKASDPVKKHQLAAIFYSIAFLLVLIGIPWDRL